MKNYLILAAIPFVFCACDKSSSPSTPPVVEKNTTIVTPGAPAPEKKVENNTTIVNPPAKEVKKTETNTTIVNPPPPAK